jgi:hypothetical protein
MISTVLLIAAFVLFVLAIFPIPSKFNLIALGLACWVLSAILAGHVVL